jgi:MFS transporter, DHA2 family, multidrug resistance protein
MTQTKPQAGAREWLGLVVIILVTLLVAIDLSVLGFAIPAISADLNPTATQLLWIMDIYSFVLAGLLITMGWVADRFGRRRLLLIGAAVFGIASGIGAFAQTPEVLIGARALLGLGAATLTPTSLALIRNMFPDAKQRKSAIAAWSGTLAGGAAVGPIVGGLMLNHFWWGSVFLINVPVMILVLILAPVLLPERRDSALGRMDLLGAFLSLAGVLPLIYGVKELVIEGYTRDRAIIAAVGVVFLIGFIIRQLTTPNPLINIRLFRSGGFSGSILVNMTVLLAFMGMSILVNQYMQLVLGMSPFEAALWSAAAMPGVAIGIGLTTFLSRRVRPPYLIGSGMLVIATGLGLLSQLEVSTNIAVVIVGIGLIAAGMIAAKTVTTEIVVTSAPSAKAGASAAISETFTEFGGALGFALLGSICASVFHNQMAGVNPPGLPGPALDAMHNTIGGAVGVAQQLPEPAQSSLLAVSREAYTNGVANAALVTAIAMVAIAVIAFLLLRKVPIEAALPHEEVDEDDNSDVEKEPVGATV